MSNVRAILPQAITSVEDKEYRIRIFADAPGELVMQRELRNVYETNRNIKYWSTWFLLKAVSPQSSKIHCWIDQKQFLLQFLQLNENTFRRHLKYLKEQELLTIDENYSIILTSYKKAAEKLNLVCDDTYEVSYNPTKNGGKQVFQYILRGEELRSEQDKQLSVLMYKLEKNPPLKNDVHYLLVKAGADGYRLCWDSRYFQERLLQLQLRVFKEGSELLDYIFTHRADINRGVASIAKAHCYKAIQSVSYLKKRMFFLKLIQVDKKRVQSEGRSRLYIPDVNGKKRDAYKWIAATKSTVLFLTDQISFLYESARKRGEEKGAKAA